MSLVLALVAGVFTWSFLEYALHNWVGHLMKGVGEFSKQHLKHHRVEGYFAPAWKKVVFAVPLTAVVAAPVWYAFGLAIALSFAVGFLGFYTYYEWLHRRLHTHAPLNGYGRWARRHHFRHHHGAPNMNHGVTSPVWDWVFGTLDPTPVVRVPRKKATVWMTATEPGDWWAADYQIIGQVA